MPARPPLEIVHSPLGRAAETAASIEAAFVTGGGPVPRRADEGFLEIGQGEWEGLHRAEIGERYAAQLSAWRHRPLEAWAPGGEPLPVVQARVRTALGRLLQALAASGGARGSLDQPQVAGYRAEPAEQPWSIVVAHDGVFKVALLTLFDLPLDRFWMWSMDLCGITVVDLRGGRPVLRAHNLTAHLAGLLDESAQEAQASRSRTGAL